MGDLGGLGTCPSFTQNLFTASGDDVNDFRDKWRCAAARPGTLITITLSSDLSLEKRAPDYDRSDGRPEIVFGLYVGPNHKLRLVGQGAAQVQISRSASAQE